MRGSVPAEQVACVNLEIHVVEIAVPAVCHDHGRTVLEIAEIVGDLAALEVGLVQRGFVDEHGDAIGFELLHHVLDGGLAEIVGTGLHGQPVDADNRVLNVLDASITSEATNSLRVRFASTMASIRFAAPDCSWQACAWCPSAGNSRHSRSWDCCSHRRCVGQDIRRR